MTLTIELPPEMADRLEREAARRGQNAEDCARVLLEESLMAAPEQSDPTLLPGGVNRRSPAELLALARERGVAPVKNFEELLGDEPGDSEEDPFDVDAFLEARRQWQQAEGFPFDEPRAARLRKRST
jgi:hypothetical protein